jgi:hypothetical protein
MYKENYYKRKKIDTSLSGYDAKSWTAMAKPENRSLNLHGKINVLSERSLAILTPNK